MFGLLGYVTLVFPRIWLIEALALSAPSPSPQHRSGEPRLRLARAPSWEYGGVATLAHSGVEH